MERWTHECMDVQSNRCLHEHMANIDIDYVFNLSKLIIKDVCVCLCHLLCVYNFLLIIFNFWQRPLVALNISFPLKNTNLIMYHFKAF